MIDVASENSDEFCRLKDDDYEKVASNDNVNKTVSLCKGFTGEVSSV
jgi:hypothetical protein